MVSHTIKPNGFDCKSNSIKYIPIYRPVNFRQSEQGKPDSHKLPVKRAHSNAKDGKACIALPPLILLIPQNRTVNQPVMETTSS